MTTTKDIAARLNLSVSTVGRALADDHRISAETKFRVNQVAEEFGYVANRAARMMRGGRSTVVGLVVPDVGNSFYSTVAHALAETMSSHEHQVMLCESGNDRQTELRHIRDLTAAQVAGWSSFPRPSLMLKLRGCSRRSPTFSYCGGCRRWVQTGSASTTTPSSTTPRVTCSNSAISASVT